VLYNLPEDHLPLLGMSGVACTVLELINGTRIAYRHIHCLGQTRVRHVFSMCNDKVVSVYSIILSSDV